MTIQSFLHQATALLEKQGVNTARLDCLVLLEDATGRERSWLLAHGDETVSPSNLRILQVQIERRTKHEPLAYIRGKTEFYGREFLVNAHTLEPRPETEDMIDLLKALWQPEYKSWQIADIGTGSGAIGITAALELSVTNIELLDIDREALATAKQNAQNYGLELACHYGDLLDGNQSPYNIILTNLPYVPDSHTINQAAMQEPKHAIFGGPDGLDLYRRLFAQLQDRNHKPVYVLTESLPFQHEDLNLIAGKHGYSQKQAEGFIQVFELKP